MSEKYEIFSAAFSANSLRATGFKSTHYALAELIDNSVQSAIEDKKNKNCNVEVIAIDKDQKLSKILVVDDAGGMSPEVLRQSLGVGRGRATEETKKNRVGQGKTSKFGLGLKQASLSQCARFEVYTWQGEDVYMSYLDNALMDEGKLRYVPEPIKQDIPEELLNIIKQKKGKSGTCVIWFDISPKTTWKTSFGLMKNAEMEFGRMYRHLIDSKNVNITLNTFNEISKNVFNEISSKAVRKSDPLFLMKNCIVEDIDLHQALPESGKYFDEVDTEEFTAENGSKIYVKYSVSNKKFRESAIGNRNPLNSFVGKMDGVSVVRNGRELEIDKSFLTKDTRERFIGVEISFDATLDDLMGVDGKKQTAANFYKRDIEELAEDEQKTVIQYLNDIEDNLSGDEVILIKISNAINNRVNTLINLVRNIRKDSLNKRGKDSAEASGSKLLEEREKKTKSDEDFKLISDAEKLKSIMEQLEAGGEDEDEKKKNAADIIGKKLRFHFTDVELPPQFLFDIELKAGIYNIKLNKKHPAFLNFFKLLSDQDDELNNGNDEPSSERGLKLLLESWARLEDEAPQNLKEQLQDIRLEWGKLARLFFKS
jgi:hypothetical protein